MYGIVTILVTWAKAMQASGGYRCAEAVGWWLCVQQASCGYRCAEALCWFYRCSLPAGNGCNLPAVAIGVLVALCWCSWVQHGSGCRPAGAIRVLRLWAGGYGCRVPAGAIGVLVAVGWWLWVQPASMERMQGASWCYLGAEAGCRGTLLFW